MEFLAATVDGETPGVSIPAHQVFLFFGLMMATEIPCSSAGTATKWVFVGGRVVKPLLPLKSQSLLLER